MQGTLPGGQDVVVKRISGISTQGLQEFKNEVILIAKLQHLNLVRLRGYCIKGDKDIKLWPCRVYNNLGEDFLDLNSFKKGVIIQYVKELDELRTQLVATRATADASVVSAQSVQLQCLQLVKKLDD